MINVSLTMLCVHMFESWANSGNRGGRRVRALGMSLTTLWPVCLKVIGGFQTFVGSVCPLCILCMCVSEKSSRNLYIYKEVYLLCECMSLKVIGDFGMFLNSVCMLYMHRCETCGNFGK